MNVRTKFEVRSFTSSWDNRGYIKNFLRSSWKRPLFLFSKIFNGLLFGWTLWMHGPNLITVALPVPEIIDWIFGWGCEAPTLGKGRSQGSGMIPFERVLMSSYRSSIVTFPLSLRVSELLPLLCSSTPLFPTPPLVSPKFTHVPLGVGGWHLAYEERRCWAKCSCS